MPNDDPFTSPRTRWWRDAKYGMFIHWGLYAVLAGEWNGKKVPGIGEWIMDNAKIPVSEYEKLAAQFNPVRFDARAWARVAKNAGMKYLVITSKHHDGFSMFDTRVNAYNIVKATPYRRDPMRDLARACRDEGIRFGFYYSIMDWHHPQANERDAARYIPQMKEQLRELVTRYDPAILWFDGEWVNWWDQAKGRDLETFLRGLKPNLVINNRIGKRRTDDGDYETPEQEIPKAALGKRLWETCMTLNDTWGYKKDDENWKSPKDVVHKLCDIASKGGNFLLNVGPTAEGVIPAPSVRILEEAGRWLQANGDAIYGTTFAPLPQPAWGRITRKGNRLYLLVFDWPAGGQPLRLALAQPVKSAGLLKRRGDVTFRPAEGGVELLLPAAPSNRYASVVTVDLAGDLAAVKSPAELTAEGRPIPAAADGSITLSANAAKLHGDAIQLEYKGDAGNIGFWLKADDYAEWFVALAAPADYAVELTYACEAGNGGDFVVQVGGEKLAGRSKPTGGWTTFKTARLGTVKAAAGKQSVTVKPSGAPRGGLMNLLSVRLVPAP